MNFSARLKKIITSQGLSIRAFEEKIGCSIGVINRCINKNTDVQSSVVIKIFTTFRDISPEWLLLGEGEMMKTCITKNSIEEPHKEVCEVKIEKEEKDEKQVPLVPLYAMAGQFPGEKEVMEYDCETYSVPGMKGADFLIQVKGNSMNPTYNSGDIVACKWISMKDVFFQWGRVYVLDTEQGPITKRIEPGHEAEQITIVSDNPDYKPFQLHLSQIYRIALVLGCIKLE